MKTIKYKRRQRREMKLTAENGEEMYRILKSLQIETCYHCEGTGKERHNDLDACHICGGAGKTVTAPWVWDVAAVLKSIEA